MLKLELVSQRNELQEKQTAVKVAQYLPVYFLCRQKHTEENRQLGKSTFCDLQGKGEHK